ncbi:hypothetical protein [Xanthobacter sp. YC-JY1]|uniref:hypothetical protein n=1 Tax=Xanthobacter sp. YC-JY1 TaxID=2419844 RepID=UPI001F40D87E|nr:hypothetical protein [Xanthobacter sp. YC-JY1]UJX44308.1 hypothetical protein D7006_05895 [Xanthobacter sp. YC-JY1]
MSAVTFSPDTLSRETRSAAPKAAAGKGFFARLMDAIIAARMEQAERELSRYVQLNGRDPLN